MPRLYSTDPDDDLDAARIDGMGDPWREYRLSGGRHGVRQMAALVGADEGDRWTDRDRGH